jgi:hypothetical protein
MNDDNKNSPDNKMVYKSNSNVIKDNVIKDIAKCYVELMYLIFILLLFLCLSSFLYLSLISNGLYKILYLT